MNQSTVSCEFKLTVEKLDLDPLIDWIPMSMAARLLGVHESQVRRDRVVLEQLELIDYTPYSNGFNRETMNALWVFRQLVNQRGRIEAIANVSKYLGESDE